MPEQKITPITYFIDKYSNMNTYIMDCLHNPLGPAMSFLVRVAEDHGLSKMTKALPTMTAPLFAKAIAEFKTKFLRDGFTLENFSEQVITLQSDIKNDNIPAVIENLQAFYMNYCLIENIPIDEKIKDQLRELRKEEYYMLITLLRYMDLFLEIIQLPQEINQS